jgi:hypothetical protein
MEKVYELGKDFRNEGMRTSTTRNSPCSRPYEAYADYHDRRRCASSSFPCRAEVTRPHDGRGRGPGGRPGAAMAARVPTREQSVEHTSVDIQEHQERNN